MDLLQIIFSGQNITIGLTGLAVISGIGFTFHSNLNKRLSRKADKEATNREFDLMHEKINKKADATVVRHMAEQVNEIHSKLMNQ